jgi:hypothetical protein
MGLDPAPRRAPASPAQQSLRFSNGWPRPDSSSVPGAYVAWAGETPGAQPTGRKPCECRHPCQAGTRQRDHRHCRYPRIRSQCPCHQITPHSAPLRIAVQSPSLLKMPTGAIIDAVPRPTIHHSDISQSSPNRREAAHVRGPPTLVSRSARGIYRISGISQQRRRRLLAAARLRGADGDFSGVRVHLHGAACVWIAG